MWSSPEDNSAARRPVRLVVTIEKAAGAQLGLIYVERNGNLEVTGCKAALLEAIAGGEAQVVEGDRLVAVNGVGGDSAKLREALSSARAATSLVLGFERSQSAMEDQVLQALSNRDWPAVRRGVVDLKASGGSVQTALLTGMLRLANEVGEREAALASLDSMNLSARDLAEVLLIEALAQDDLLAAAGHLLGMRQNGHIVTVELAAQLCAAGLRLARFNEVLPVLSFLGLQPEEFMMLMKLCQSHQQDPTARFLQLYEACVAQRDRSIHAEAETRLRIDQSVAAADARVDWLARKIVTVTADLEAAQNDALLQACFDFWVSCLPASKAEHSFASVSTTPCSRRGSNPFGGSDSSDTPCSRRGSIVEFDELIAASDELVELSESPRKTHPPTAVSAAGVAAGNVSVQSPPESGAEDELEEMLAPFSSPPAPEFRAVQWCPAAIQRRAANQAPAEGSSSAAEMRAKVEAAVQVAWKPVRACVVPPPPEKLEGPSDSLDVRLRQVWMPTPRPPETPRMKVRGGSESVPMPCRSLKSRLLRSPDAGSREIQRRAANQVPAKPNQQGPVTVRSPRFVATPRPGLEGSKSQTNTFAAGSASPRAGVGFRRCLSPVYLAAAAR
jgi:hypothetical protein